jgi:hypothetical protein
VAWSWGGGRLRACLLTFPSVGFYFRMFFSEMGSFLFMIVELLHYSAGVGALSGLTFRRWISLSTGKSYIYRPVT